MHDEMWLVGDAVYFADMRGFVIDVCRDEDETMYLVVLEDGRDKWVPETGLAKPEYGAGERLT